MCSDFPTCERFVPWIVRRTGFVDFYDLATARQLGEPFVYSFCGRRKLDAQRCCLARFEVLYDAAQLKWPGIHLLRTRASDGAPLNAGPIRPALSEVWLSPTLDVGLAKRSLEHFLRREYGTNRVGEPVI
jgi:hypothetical protein